MRILSWNINGIRTLPMYHPWNTLKTTEAMLDHLQADVICFQEMKSSRSGLDKSIALPGHFDSFFSFPVHKSGYSGVAVYTDANVCVPHKAEEGLTGAIQPRPSLAPDERISSPTSYPRADAMSEILFADEEGKGVPATLDALDSEGRALVLDFGLFVLINLYCPNETSEARLPFKMNYHLMVEERVKKLVEEGREVIVLGDINICATPLDHGDGHLASQRETFYDRPPRQWMKRWTSPVEEGGAGMVDVVRTFWPGRRDMYTCWNTKISARESNYGTRVDYILVTLGLLPWIKHGDIQPSVKGSDHCPIYIDLHDEITLDSGEKKSLKQEIGMAGEEGKRDPPRIAAKFWDEHKQKSLSSFFVKKGAVGSQAPVVSRKKSPPSSQNASEPMVSSIPVTAQPPIPVNPATSTSSSEPIPSSSKRKLDSSPTKASFSEQYPSTKFSKKIKINATVTAKSSKTKTRSTAGQTKLSSFFAKPAPESRSSSVTKASNGVEGGDNASNPVDVDAEPQLEEEVDEATLALIARLTSTSSPPPSQESKQESAQKWSTLLAPVDPPRCTVHDEPAKELTTKQGKNKGKCFWICSRPVGPGYDKGRAERLREEVDPRWRCDFFKWSSEVRREARTAGG